MRGIYPRTSVWVGIRQPWVWYPVHTDDLGDVIVTLNFFSF